MDNDDNSALKYAERACLLNRAGMVKRYHTLPLIKEETTACHSWGVAMLCDILSMGAPSAQLLKAALYHDSAEMVTGDIPFTAKSSHHELARAAQEMENSFNYINELTTCNDLTEDEKVVLKWADMLQLLIKCYDECRLGNINTVQFFWRGAVYLDTLPRIPVGMYLLSRLKVRMRPYGMFTDEF